MLVACPVLNLDSVDGTAEEAREMLKVCCDEAVNLSTKEMEMDNKEIFDEIFRDQDDDVAEMAWNELRQSSGLPADDFRRMVETWLEVYLEDDEE